MDEVKPPGSYLKEVLTRKHYRQADLARWAGWSAKFVSQLATGKVPLTVDTALVLEQFTGVSARSWLIREADWQLSQRASRRA